MAYPKGCSKSGKSLFCFSCSEKQVQACKDELMHPPKTAAEKERMAEEDNNRILAAKAKKVAKSLKEEGGEDVQKSS